MFKLKKKNLIYPALAFFLLALFSGTVPALKTPVLNILRFPISLFTFIRHEIGGVIFYHHNMVENERFESEIGALRQRLKAAEEAELENKRLKSLFSFKQNSPYKVVAARVIGRASDNWSSLILIDKGNHQGIKRGLVVVNYLGLVGRVMEAGGSTSKVMLINDPNVGVSAIVQRSRQEGLVSGTLGNSLMMRYLPLDSDIRPADAVITSGLTDMYPKGLVIGTVTSVGEEFSGLSRYAIIRPAVNLASLEEVLVIIP